MFPLLNANKHIVITHYQIKHCVKRSNYKSLNDFCYGKYGDIPMHTLCNHQSTLFDAKETLPQHTAWSNTCMPSSSVSPIARSLHLTSR